MAEERIMITDDDTMSLQNARDLLTDAGFKVNVTRSGRDLLRFMEKHTPDLILLDIRMPQMDGFETYTGLRRLEKSMGRKAAPVIFLTGENDVEAEQKGLLMGACDYVRKPFKREILLKRISNAIQNSKIIESLTEEAEFDRLTGFLNKAATAKKLTQVCNDENGMLAILDLDSFKLVNDLFGHQMGDRVLVTFADIVRRTVRREDILCRIGGDEFLVFCKNAMEEKAVAALAKRLNEQLVGECKNLMGEEFGIPIGVSVGAVFVPFHGKDYTRLFPLADKMLYQVKRNGKHGYAVYGDRLPEEEQEAAPENEFAHLMQIVEERNTSSSPLWVSQEAFTGAYRLMKRYPGKEDGSAVSVFLSVSAAEEENEDGLSKAAEYLGKLLGETLAAKDLIWQSRPTQFLVLLPAQNKESAGGTMERIRQKWQQADSTDGFLLTCLIQESVS